MVLIEYTNSDGCILSGSYRIYEPRRCILSGSYIRAMKGAFHMSLIKYTSSERCSLNKWFLSNIRAANGALKWFLSNTRAAKYAF